MSDQKEPAEGWPSDEQVEAAWTELRRHTWYLSQEVVRAALVAALRSDRP